VAIFIRRPPDPLSEESGKAAWDSVSYTAAPSEASRILKEELRRYCNGYSQGRSFLIAGHRGSGKTTAVSDVLATVTRLSQGGDVALRPLPVMLHGPSLFWAAPSENRETAGKSAASDRNEDSEFELQAQLALKQIILGLHRAVVREYAAAYRRRLVPQQGVAASTRSAERSERGELAAQFELELMEDPPAARLRELWDYIDAIDVGILFPNGRVADPQQARRARETNTTILVIADQGARELVALNGICNAHQRISGDLSGETSSKLNKTWGFEKTRGMDLKLADALKPVAAILSGAAVAGGSLASSALTLSHSLLLGVAIAIGSSFAFKSTSTATGKRERQIDKKFIPDLSLRTLDRILPTLLERLRNAGLAPVFVIDELDKVEGLSDRIKAMVHYLKKLVAENVFTCFLTDRSYMESLRMAARESAYGVAYSYFSHPLLLAHEPADFDAYLDSVLEVATDRGSQGDGADKEILKWVLRHRSQMHALNLTRELAALRSDSGHCNLPSGTVRDATTYKIDATLQVAIEFCLNDETIVGWSLQRPNMRQVLFDALYYISRAWLSGKAEIDLRSKESARLSHALYSRINLEEVFMGQRGMPGNGVPADAEASLISKEDLVILFYAVGKVAQFLCGGMSAAHIQAQWPSNRLERDGGPKSPRPPQPVLEVLMLGQKAPLIPDKDRADVYSFRYYPSGALRNSTTPPTREPHEIFKAMKDQLSFISTLEKTLVESLALEAGPTAAAGLAFKLLSDDFHVFPQTPPWQQATAAHQSLTQAERGVGNSADLEKQRFLLSDFVQMLRDHLHSIGPVLVSAAFLAGLRPSAEKPTAPLVEALRILSSGLQFSPTTHGGSLRSFQDNLQRLKFTLPSARPFDSGSGSAAATLTSQLTSAEELGQTFAAQYDWNTAAYTAWEQLIGRLAASERGSAFAAGMEEILCAARGVGPVRVLPFDLEDVPLRVWTDALVKGTRPWRAAKSDDLAATGVYVPFGIVAHALLRLGLRGFETSLIMTLCSAIEQIAGVPPKEVNALATTISQARVTKTDTAPPFGTVIVVRKPQASVTEAWTGSPTRALFVVLTVEEFKQLASVPKSILSVFPLPVTVIWEKSDPKDANEELLRAESRRLNMPFQILEPEYAAPFATARGADDIMSLIRTYGTGSTQAR
jgi:hypothetical protein